MVLTLCETFTFTVLNIVGRISEVWRDFLFYADLYNFRTKRRIFHDVFAKQNKGIKICSLLSLVIVCSYRIGLKIINKKFAHSLTFPVKELLFLSSQTLKKGNNFYQFLYMANFEHIQ